MGGEGGDGGRCGPGEGGGEVGGGGGGGGGGSGGAGDGEGDGEGGGEVGGEVRQALLASTVRLPALACSSPWPRSTYRSCGANDGSGNGLSTIAWQAAFWVHSCFASPKPELELMLCSGAPVCAKSTFGSP